MAELLPLIKVVPELNLTLDPSSGMLGAALGRDVVIVSMDDIDQQISDLEETAEDLMNSLDPSTVAAGSYPGREGVYLTAGKLTNMVYGFVLGLVLLIALLL